MVLYLDGIRQKIERGKENLSNLDREVKSFLDHSSLSSILDRDPNTIREFAISNVGRTVPIRFSVLAGEVIHQLRSSLDHLAWQLSDETYRQRQPTAIEFPIFRAKPHKSNRAREYDRKVHGMSEQSKSIIEELQPYRTNPPENSLLQTLHDLSITDKHRELYIVKSAFRHTQYPGWQDPSRRGTTIQSDSDFPSFNVSRFDPAHDLPGTISLQVAFSQFGVLKYQPIVPSLQQLVIVVEHVVSLLSVGAR